MVESAGARIVCSALAVQIHPEGERVLVRVRGDAGLCEVECEMVVVAAGFGGASLLNASYIFPLRGQNFATAPVREGFRATTPAASFERGHLWLCSTSGGGVLVAGIRPDSTWSEKTSKLEVDDRFQAYMHKKASAYFWGLSEVEVLSRWSSIYTFTADGLPVIGPMPGYQRILVAAGFATCSWGLGFGAGLALAQMIAGEGNNLPPGSSPRRFMSWGDKID